MPENLNQDCWYKDVCDFDSCKLCVKYIEMQSLFDSSNLPMNLRQPIHLKPFPGDEGNYNKLQSIGAGIEGFVKSGGNLYLYSEYTGNGKTSWAVKLLQKYFESIWCGNGLRVRGIFIHVPTFMLQLKNFRNPLPNEFLDDIMKSDLVVFDDIGGVVSSYDYTQLLSYIDSRILQKKSCIFTSNCDKDELAKTLGNRLTSRIWNTAWKIHFVGGDLR